MVKDIPSVTTTVLLILLGLISAAGVFLFLTHLQHQRSVSELGRDTEDRANRLLDSIAAVANVAADSEGRDLTPALQLARQLTTSSYGLVQRLDESDRMAFVDDKKSMGFAFYELMELKGPEFADPVPIQDFRNEYVVLDFNKAGKPAAYVKGLDLLSVPAFAELLKDPHNGVLTTDVIPLSENRSGITFIIAPDASPTMLAAILSTQDLFNAIPYATSFHIDGTGYFIRSSIRPRGTSSGVGHGGRLESSPGAPLGAPLGAPQAAAPYTRMLGVPFVAWVTGLTRIVGGVISLQFFGSDVQVQWESISRANPWISIPAPLVVLLLTVVVSVGQLIDRRKHRVYQQGMKDMLFLKTNAVPSVVRRHNEHH